MHRIVIFDSGMGGLTVARAVRAALPDAHLFYAADADAFPYGSWSEAALIERICTVAGRCIERVGPDVVVIGCNTASTLALDHLRQRFRVPFVGTVPAIKPAAQHSASGIVGVLATPATVTREYTRALIETYAYHCRVVLHGAEKLAQLAEAKLSGRPVCADEVAAQIGPVFIEEAGKRTDTIVLGCTHYPLLLDELNAAAPWQVTFVDPAPAIARRVCAVVAGKPRAGTVSGLAPDTLLTTGEPADTPAAYEQFGFGTVERI